MFSKNKRKKRQEDLNQRVCKYQRWWQDQTGDPSFSRSCKADKKSSESRLKPGETQRVLDDSFVYYEGN
jgi:hypothetical protein